MASTFTALDGVRVLDFTRVLAGPYCTMMLADLGADVLKVEAPERGDDTRHWGPPWAGAGPARQSAYFLSVNRNKRSLTLNLKHPHGQRIARRLAARSHIVVENFRPGQMGAFGLAYEDLRADNPALVYCSITGFGQTGPYRDRPGYDYAIQAMSGLMSITGPAEGEPYKVGVAIADVLTGLFATSAVLAALRHAEHTGQGQQIDLALLEAQIAALVNVASGYLVSGMAPARYGNQHPNIVPYQTFRAADGDFVLAVGNDGQFRALCELIGRPELAHEVRFASNPARVENRAELVALLGDIFVQQPAAHWVEAALAAGIPAGPIHDIPAILDDSHIRARGLVQETLLPDESMLRLVGSPLHLGETPPVLRRPPPLLGQHSDEALAEWLGMDTDEIAAARAEGAV